MSSIMFKDYAPELVNTMIQYANYAASKGYPELAYTKHNPEYGDRIWDIAHRIKGTPSHWGGIVPGVSVDCAGSVVTMMSMAGLYTVPKSILSASQGTKNREQDFDVSRLDVNKKFASFLLYFAFKCVRHDLMTIPVINPENVYPGDIFSIPYISVCQGITLMPHTSVFVSKTSIMTTDIASQSVDVVDFTKFNIEQYANEFAGRSVYAIAWRVIPRENRDEICVAYEKKLLSEARKIVPNIPEETDDDE